MVDPGKFYVGNIGRVPLYVAFEALFLLLFVAWVAPPGQVGIAIYLITLTSLLATIVMHELGHAAVAIGTGMTGVSITLGAMGGYCSYTGDRRPKRVLPITLAGVAMNFLLWWLASSLAPHLLGSGSEMVWAFVSSFAFWNLLLGIFNSLPIYPLDGGQAVLLLAQMTAKTDAAARRFTLSLTVAAAVAALAYWSKDHGLSMWNAFLAVTLLLQAFRDLR